jgi:hypothetical protein
MNLRTTSLLAALSLDGCKPEYREGKWWEFPCGLIVTDGAVAMFPAGISHTLSMSRAAHRRHHDAIKQGKVAWGHPWGLQVTVDRFGNLRTCWSYIYGSERCGY